MMKALLSSVVALTLLTGPAAAALGAAPECIIPSADIASVRGFAIASTLYSGPDAKVLLAVLIGAGGPPPIDLSRTDAILLLVRSDDVEPPVMFRFYGADGCVFFAASTDRAGLVAILAAFGGRA